MSLPGPYTLLKSSTGQRQSLYIRPPRPEQPQDPLISRDKKSISEDDGEHFISRLVYFNGQTKIPTLFSSTQ